MIPMKTESWENMTFDTNCFIDQGSFAMVLKGKWKKFPHFTSLNSPIVAVKMITETLTFAQRKNFETEKSTLMNEAMLLWKCKEYSVRTIIEVFGIVEGRLSAEICKYIPSAKENDQAFGIILDFFDGKTLQRLLFPLASEVKPRLSMEEKLRILCEIMAAIHDLHASGVVHGDLKPQNILISGHVPPLVKIIDFGLSKEKAERLNRSFADSSLLPASEYGGTLFYCAPENNYLMDGRFHEPTRSSDVYSFAVLAWEFLTEQRAFIHRDFIQDLRTNKRPRLSDLPTDTPSTVLSLIENCWDSDRKKRLSSAVCLSLVRQAYEQMKGGLFDVFFSHASINKDILSNVHNLLTRYGYRVWYDENHMGFNLKESMRKGIEASKIVLICLNQHYQTRVHCLYELHLAMELGKPIIVLLLESDPDRWMCNEVAEFCDLKGKLYVDISKLLKSFDWAKVYEEDITASAMQTLTSSIGKLITLFQELGCHPMFSTDSANYSVKYENQQEMQLEDESFYSKDTFIDNPVNLKQEVPIVFDASGYSVDHDSRAIGVKRTVFPLPAGKRAHVFLSHDWEVEGSNHLRVKRINEGLKSRGLITWLDMERMMDGDIAATIARGIDEAACMIVFVTERTIDVR